MKKNFCLLIFFPACHRASEVFRREKRFILLHHFDASTHGYRTYLLGVAVTSFVSVGKYAIFSTFAANLCMHVPAIPGINARTLGDLGTIARLVSQRVRAQKSWS